MGSRQRFIGFAAGLLRVLVWLNVAYGVVFALVMIGSWPGGGVAIAWFAHKYGPRMDAVGLLWAVRAMLATGVAGAAVVHRILDALVAMVRSVRGGDPFRRDNVARLRTIGWAMLALQLLDLCLGLVEHRVAALGAQVPGWTPSVGGWLTVLVAFVLAQVFAQGAAMRDDLAGTV